MAKVVLLPLKPHQKRQKAPVKTVFGCFMAEKRPGILQFFSVGFTLILQGIHTQRGGTAMIGKKQNLGCGMSYLYPIRSIV